MPPRASWKGQLKISLVAFPICLYNATSSSSRIGLNQLHKGCNRRLKQQMTCPEHGPVERDDIAKGYEFEKDKYVIIDEADLDKIKLETNRTVEILQFVDAGEIAPIYLDSPYYVAPDGPVAEESFRVIREAIRRGGKVGIGRVVMSGREHAVVLQAEGKGFLLNTLRTADEVRAADPYMEGIRDGEIAADQLALAQQLIQAKSAAFDPSQFRDRYQDALLAIIKAKVEGNQPIVTQEAEVGQVINLMEALKQSLAASAPTPAKKPAAASVDAAPEKRRKTKRA
ncbi:MAG: Ku protein [Phycisphaerae bacterium]